jgi:hypothetical protein
MDRGDGCGRTVSIREEWCVIHVPAIARHPTGGATMSTTKQDQETTMEYMLLINSDEQTETPTPGTPEFDEMMGEWFAFNQRLIDGGHWLAGAMLAPTATATTLRTADGASSVTDGPYAETKEQFGGFYMITAADLDEALELARGIPMPQASIEVRPIAFRPDAG